MPVLAVSLVFCACGLIFVRKTNLTGGPHGRKTKVYLLVFPEKQECSESAVLVSIHQIMSVYKACTSLGLYFLHAENFFLHLM